MKKIIFLPFCLFFILLLFSCSNSKKTKLTTDNCWDYIVMESNGAKYELKAKEPVEGHYEFSDVNIDLKMVVPFNDRKDVYYEYIKNYNGYWSFSSYYYYEFEIISITGTVIFKK